MSQTNGKWEITVTAKVPNRVGRLITLKPQEKKLIIEKPTLEEAIKEALIRSSKSPNGQAAFKSSRTISEPAKPASSVAQNSSSTDINARDAAETVLGTLSVSSEFSGMIAEIKKIQKLADKLGGAGKVFTGIDAANDIIKYYEALYKFSQTTDKKKQKELMIEMVLIVGKLTKTAITVAFPPLAIVDAGFGAIGLLYQACEYAQSVSDKKKAGKAALDAFIAIEEKYKKEPGALKLPEKGYCFELGLYRLGSPMADIKERRRVLQNKKEFKGFSFTNTPAPINPYKGGPLDEHAWRQAMINSLTVNNNGSGNKIPSSDAVKLHPHSRK